MIFFRLFLLALFLLPAAATRAEGQEVRIEHMTWVEVQAALDAGKTTIIIPTGGTEQNGPHMVLGKHNFIVAETARRIAEKLGDALVAPVLAYVPQGNPALKQGHMAFAGTISLPETVFEAVLEATATSFKTHGFKTIVFFGDSGGNQAVQKRLAARLSKEWHSWLGTSVNVLSASKYYAANGGDDALKQEGETPQSIGTHAGIRDTSELLAIYPEGVDLAKASPDGKGNNGDPRRASRVRGEMLLRLKVDTAVREILAAR